MAGGNQQAGIPQNLTAGRAQGYGGYPGMGAGMGSPYANSGLGRFGSIGTYNPVPYTPRVYQPGLLTIPNRGPYVPPPMPGAGLLDPGGTGGAGAGGNGSGVGGISGTGIGTPGPGGGDAGVNSTPGAVSGINANNAAAIGATAAGPIGGLVGLGFGAANSAAQGVQAPVDDGTTVGIQAAIDAMGLGDGSAPGSTADGNAAPSGVSANADGSPAGTAVGGEAGDGSGGGGGSGK